MRVLAEQRSGGFEANARVAACDHECFVGEVHRGGHIDKLEPMQRSTSL